ncbi:MAG: polysaccharide deacetylase family protein [Minisyncoccota bacterium]
MKDFFKEIFFKLLPKIPLAKDRASILMYHSISDRKDYFSAVSPEIFNKQMTYLAAKKRGVISLAELARRLRAGEPLGGSVVLTFDDGYRDNYTTVFPLLEQYGFPATIFVTTDFIGEPGYCSAEELREMQASGIIALEPHTLSHPKLAKLPRAEAEREMRESRRVLQEILGTTPTLFAYPYGNFSEETVGLAREAGFVGTVTVEEGAVGLDTDPLRLPRNSIDRSTTFEQFRGKVSRAIDWYTSLKSSLHL